jgi:hypothetical protein
MAHLLTKAGWRAFGNRVSRRLFPLGLLRLCREAQRRTGLEDFGTPPLEPALSILVDSLEHEADLHPLGRFLMRMHLRGLLETRLRLTEAWKAQAEALETSSIRAPVFVVGMPRSGSTFLHELLAEDANHRAPRVWEVMFPVPGRGGGQGEQQRRIRKAAACLWWFRRLAPRADAVYPMRAWTPHECVAIHSYTFRSEEFISTCRIPSYEAFLRSGDLTALYAWERRFLQYLQLGSSARRWVLKSPDHVYGLDELFSVFPDAVIIQTHRNPFEVLRSSTDLTQVLQGLYARPRAREEVRARETRVLAEGTEQFIRFRDLHPELADRFIDVKYTELSAEPMAAVERIYRRLQSPLTPEAAERMRRLAGQRSRYRGPRASANPSEATPVSSEEAGRFERYCSRFGLSYEGRA